MLNQGGIPSDTRLCRHLLGTDGASPAVGADLTRHKKIKPFRSPFMAKAGVYILPGTDLGGKKHEGVHQEPAGHSPAAFVVAPSSDARTNPGMGSKSDAERAGDDPHHITLTAFSVKQLLKMNHRPQPADSTRKA